MKAAVVEKFGGLEQIHVRDIPTPTPRKGEVKIEVHAVGVNPVEWKITEGVLKDVLPHQFPFVLGWDVAGVVCELGEGVTNLKKGDHVFGYCRGDKVHVGTFADYVCFDAHHVVQMPSNLSFAQAAALPLVALTAWQALFDVADLKKGQTCLILAGAGGVGSVAIPLARWAGATVGTTARSANDAYVRKLGANFVIDHSKENVWEALKKRYPKGVDFVFDCVGGDALRDCYQMVKKGGHLVSIVAAPDRKKADSCGIHASHVFVRPNGEELTKIKDLIEKHQLPLPQIEEMPFDQLIPALEQIKGGHTRGKIVLNLK
jgi:NADPH:quinone reductase-like Zn-dependent oxidoreductase